MIVDPVPRAKVLIIDDEELITSALRRHLQGDHDVTVINDPLAALALIRSGNAFDVILCDLVMPRMTGVELHRELRATDPEQAAATILMSGGSMSESDHQHLTDDGVPSLNKPFNVDELRSLIESVRLRSVHPAPA